ncbi:MAG: hypothetical protein ABFC57_17305 [Veillonellales bacterium]
MVKHISLVITAVICSSLAAGICSASPLTDYSQGKTAVNINWFPNLQMKDHSSYPSFTGSAINDTVNANGKRGNFDWSLTTGLGGNWAIQYRQFNPKSRSSDISKFGMKTQEVNVLYKLDKNVSAFSGWHQGKYDFLSSGDTTTTSNKNTLQVGLVGITRLAPKTQLYGVIGFGKDLENYEIGTSYALDKNLDFDLLYRYKKVKKLYNIEYNVHYHDDVTAKGLGCGITYKF